MSKVLELQEEKGRLVTQMRELSEKADKEKRSLTAEEDAQYTKMDEDFEAVSKRIEREMKLENATRSIAEIEFAKKQKEGGVTGDNDDSEKRYADAFKEYCTRGFGRTSPENQDLLQKRALSTTTGSEGGYLVPEGFSKQIAERMAYEGPMLTVGYGLNTTTGNPIPWPTNDDTANEGEWLDQNADHSDGTEPTFGILNLTAYELSSKIIGVPNALIQDSYFDFAQFLNSAIAKRLGRSLNKKFTIGTGSGEPHGIVTGAAASGVTAAVSALTFDNLIDLQYSLDDAYDMNGAWMFNKSTLKTIMKLKDSDGQYIWAMGNVKAGTPDTILGRPYYKNPYMAAIGASAKSVIYGDFSNWVRRSSQGISMYRLSELLMTKNQTGFMAICRYDSRVIQPQGIKSLVHAAS